MKTQLIVILLIISCCSFGQKTNNNNCKIEFYLLKTNKPNIDTTKVLRAEFLLSKFDLQEKPFIVDEEILGYKIKKQKVKLKETYVEDIKQSFVVTDSIIKRINDLEIPLGSGKQFALVVNGEILYSGYFWNFHSSWGCDAITAIAYDNKIEILRKLPDYDFAIDSQDPRRDSDLFDCLIKTNRLVNE